MLLPARALALWSERMAFALDAIDEAGPRIERKVVQNEYYERASSSSYHVHMQHQLKLYGPGHPLATSRQEAAVKSATSTCAACSGS
jgi:hypothetical protein